MPAPPASRTVLDLSMRALLPRLHSTTAPATFAGSSEPARHSSASATATPGAAEAAASTSGAAGSAWVTDAPSTVNDVPSWAVMVAVAWKVRASDAAATLVIHGTAFGAPTVPAP